VAINAIWAEQMVPAFIPAGLTALRMVKADMLIAVGALDPASKYTALANGFAFRANLACLFCYPFHGVT